MYPPFRRAVFAPPRIHQYLPGCVPGRGSDGYMGAVVLLPWLHRTCVYDGRGVSVGVREEAGRPLGGH